MALAPDNGDPKPAQPRSDTGDGYEVKLHKPTVEFRHSKREEYFGDLERASCQKQIVFLDPDIGFQPAKTINKKHVKYSDMQTIRAQLHKESVVVVFQHGRRRHAPFCAHYEEIRAGAEPRWEFSYNGVVLVQQTDVGRHRKIKRAD